MESSQDYSFNKAHAACYALIAYRTAWLKANHPREYMAALISSVMNTKDRVPFYVNACREMGIEVLPPDVNSSQQDFAVVEGSDPLRPERGEERRRGRRRGDRPRARGGRAVRVDLGVHRARRSAGRQQARARVARQVRRARLDRRNTAGDARERPRLRARLRLRAGRRPARRAGLDLRRRARRRPRPPRSGTIRRSRRPSSTSASCCGSRRRRSGCTSRSTRSSESRAELRRKTDCALTDVERRRDGEIVTVGGIVSGLKQVTTKRGDPMVFVALEDPTGSAEVVVFNSTYAAARELPRARPHPRRQGARRPQAGGRDEAHRAGGQPVRGRRRCAREVRLRIDARAGARRADPRARGARLATSRAKRPSTSRSRHRSASARSRSAPSTGCKPDADFFAEARALLGEAALVSTSERRLWPGRPKRVSVTLR